MTDPFPSREPELWCRGCRRAGARVLTDAERAWIGRLRIRHRWRVAIGLAIVPLAILLGAAASTVLRRLPGDAATGVIGAWGFATILLGAPVSILLVRDHLRGARELGEDLALGSAWVFEPPADSAPVTAAAREEMRSPTVAAFALLEKSRRVVDPQDGAPHVSHEDVIEVEPHSGSSLYAPLSLEVERLTPGLRLHQRALSDPERTELEGLRRGLKAPRIGTVLTVAALIGLVSLFAGAGGRPRLDIGEFLAGLLWIAICVRLLVRDARSLLLARRIRQDLYVGLVVRADHDAETGSEFLPVSRLLWRLGGAPAAWRDRGRGATRLRRNL